jgi:hypothetical protein
MISAFLTSNGSGSAWSARPWHLSRRSAVKGRGYGGTPKLTSAGPEHDRAHVRRSSFPAAIRLRRAPHGAFWSKLELLSLPRPGRDRFCHRGARICELQRLERVDESRAEIVVALASRRKPLGACRQNAAYVGGRELGVALEQQRHDPANLRGGHRRTCSAGTRMSTPGAATETYLPRLAPANSLSSTSVAVTAITLE